jgi:hypothetical protein
VRTIAEQPDAELGLESAKRLRAAALVCVLAIALHASAARAEDNIGAEAGLGAAAGWCSLVYAPLKIVYAVGGLVVGGLAWGLSGGDSDVMYAVLTPSVRGDYVVTPSHLRGEHELEFIGREPQYRPPSAVVEEPY